jgi:hypothetical protein
MILGNSIYQYIYIYTVYIYIQYIYIQYIYISNLYLLVALSYRMNPTIQNHPKPPWPLPSPEFRTCPVGDFVAMRNKPQATMMSGEMVI